MTCIDVKDIVTEYGKVMDLVKEICSDRACTLDAIQKSLETKGIVVGDAALLSVIAQIKEMMVFSKEHTYDIGDVVTYRCRRKWGLIMMSESIGNVIRRIEYKSFYLYNDKRFGDDAFREHMYSKLKFEELGKTDTNNFGKLLEALQNLKIKEEELKNYVFVDDKNQVYCVKKSLGSSITEYLGELIRRERPISDLF